MSITFEHVTKRFDRAVLDDCTLHFADGRITALVGESGRGKTTVLRLIRPSTLGSQGWEWITANW